MSFFDELAWRDLIYDATPGLEDALRSGKLVGYVGFDPSASSLHVGSLLPIMLLARLQRAGHTPIAIAGGGTGLIGDPSGKNSERQLLTHERVEENLAGIRQQLTHFLDFEAADNSARVINNAEWLTTAKLIDFLRDIGKHFTVNSMLARESVKRRLDSGDGLSFTEFSYSLLQAYDYLMLHDRHGCTLQMGGSDQWGNITAGADLIRRRRGTKAYALVSPLITTASGVKFGKTEAGTVWLDAERTSPYSYYQYWLNTDDRDVVRYLKFFTWLDRESIAELEQTVVEAPDRREAQRALAEELTRITHGREPLERARRVSELFFGEDVTQLEAQEVMDVLGDAPSSEIPAAEVAAGGVGIIDLLVRAGLASSKGDARRTLKGGGVYLNNHRLSDPDLRLSLGNAIDEKIFLLRKGKKQYHAVLIR
ncbi:MAG: tyrosine--tRNA ligase [Thermoanaerobaculia bacterium]